MDIRNTDTAIVFIDPQNDVLSETAQTGARSALGSPRTARSRTWRRSSRPRSGTGTRFSFRHTIFYPSDSGWKMNGTREADEFRTRTFARSGPLDLTGFSNSGADWLGLFKPLSTIGLSRTWRCQPTKCSPACVEKAQGKTRDSVEGSECEAECDDHSFVTLRGNPQTRYANRGRIENE
jgi:hypothetical protein